MNPQAASANALPVADPQPDVRHELELTTNAVVAAHDAFLANALLGAGSERRGLLRTLRRTR